MNYYIGISTPKEFQAIKDNPNAKYKLLRDIDFKDFNFNKIQNFNGILDGQGFCIQ